ncbi:MAG TPA: bifunctional serine/threonine-protein kinase/formylglycine-generating enzyme family protein [Verrucomicrobiales bacterium]|nr:bifunctional serine/threonine-protein kinase/formylglycine-generating enzyme family protein [Verrucomicrobiales bacterium]
MSDPPPSSRELNGLDPAGVMRGVLGEGSSSWPAEGPVAWAAPDPDEIAVLFPGFEDVRFVNRGGMGAVYSATQITLDRRVALKLLPAELSRDPAAAERFRREARALGRLNHPNIVSIHDFGETRDGTFFFVMEYVEGADLHRLIREGRLPVPEALSIVRQVCDALEFAHGQGFVHRDIKPSNILVDAQGRVKVSDFGLAKLMPEHSDVPDEPTPTMTGSVVGTPDYVAPEQRRGDRPVDHRADIYSLGVMFYEMLTGRVPCGAFEPPSRRAGTGEALDRVVERAMQEEPEKRYQHAAEVKSEVDKASVPGNRGVWWKAGGLLALAAGAAWIWTKWPNNAKEENPMRPGNAAAPSMDVPVTNGLGITLLPTGTPGVLMAVGEVRRRDFEAFVRAKGPAGEGDVMVPNDTSWTAEPGSWETPPGLPAQSPDHPVVAVDQMEAEAFCLWLTAQERAAGRLGSRERYRLPTVDEWLTATGRTGGLEAYQVKLSASVVPSPERTGPVPVVMMPADAVRDLDGNVAEWTSTLGPNAQHRLVCGRSWAEETKPDDEVLPIRSYVRTLRGVALGFRLVLDRRMAP